MTFGLSPSYGILEAREAHEWSLEMMREHEQFEVETDKAGELPMPFWSETVKRVRVEWGLALMDQWGRELERDAAA